MTMITNADVIVIGGGIVGSAAAYYLAKRDARVILVEKGNIADEQSSRAWGFVRMQGRDPSELPLMVAGNRLWQGLSEELSADIEWVQGGNLGLAGDEARMEQYRGWLPLAKEFGLDTRLLSRAEVQQLVPALQGPFVGGMYTASDGHAEPRKATIAFARGAGAGGDGLHSLRRRGHRGDSGQGERRPHGAGPATGAGGRLRGGCLVRAPGCDGRPVAPLARGTLDGGPD